MTMKSEEEYRSKIDPFLGSYFYIDREVWSTDKRRIDYILKCKESGALFGLEVKNDTFKRGQTLGEFAKQAQDYSKMYWKSRFTSNPIKVIVFIAPAISNSVKQIDPCSKVMLKPSWYKGEANYNFEGEYYQVFHQAECQHSNVHSMLTTLGGFGEVRKFEGKIHFMYNNKVIWKSNRTNRLHEVNYNFYNPK